MGEAFITRRGGTGGGGGGPTASDAILIVTVPTGSTVTMTKGGVTLTPTMWVKAADTSLDCAIFSIPASQFDSTTPWTITATGGTDSASDTVLITSNKEYEITLSFTFRLYYYGNTMDAVTGGWSSSHGGGSGVKMNTDNIEIYQVATSGRGASVYSNNRIDFTDYSTIHFIFTNSAASTYAKGGVSDATISADSTFLAATVFPVSTSEAEMVVDISSITGLHYPRIYGGIDNILRIYAVWLE